MLLVVPVSKHDEGLLEDFCGAVNFFGSYTEHHLLIVTRPSDASVAQKMAALLTNGQFKTIETFVFSEDGPKGWPQGPNFYWTETILYLAESKNTLPWFWMEMDTTPVDEGWLNDLETEYRSTGALCLGVLQKGEFEVAPHLAGVAVYPPRLDLAVQSWRYAVSSNTAFDVFCASELVPITTQSKILQHNFRTGGYRCTKDGIRGTDLQRSPVGDSFASPVKPETRLVHGCNDGSLARIFTNKLNPKIFTYYEDVGFSEQEALVKLWVKNWGAHGFEPIVLGPEDAEKHPYYEEFMDSMNRLHLEIMKCPLKPYGRACYKRWLAFSGVNYSGGFSVADYDVFNKDFVECRFDKLTFFNWRCPCFAYGTAEQYLMFCKTMAFVLYEATKQAPIVDKFKHFHDQEFLCSYGDNFSDIFTLIPWEKRKVSLYGEAPQRELVHVAHVAVKNVAKTAPALFSGVKFDDVRLLFASNFTVDT